MEHQSQPAASPQENDGAATPREQLDSVDDLSAVPAPDDEPRPYLAQAVPALTESYHKARKQLVLWSGVLLAWELVGVDQSRLEGQTGSFFNALERPGAVPWVLFVVVSYFGFRTSVEWAQCDQERRRRLAAKYDLRACGVISSASITVLLWSETPLGSTITTLGTLIYRKTVTLFELVASTPSQLLSHPLVAFLVESADIIRLALGILGAVAFMFWARRQVTSSLQVISQQASADKAVLTRTEVDALGRSKALSASQLGALTSTGTKSNDPEIIRNVAEILRVHANVQTASVVDAADTALRAVHRALDDKGRRRNQGPDDAD